MSRGSCLVNQQRTHLDEVDALWLHSPDGFRSAMQERLGHCRFICTFDPACNTDDQFWSLNIGKRDSLRTVHPKIGRLERHLDKGVRAKAVRSDERLPVTAELKCLDVVLADQIA